MTTGNECTCFSDGGWEICEYCCSHDEDFSEPKEKSEHDEWREDDNARRYREYESDNRRPY